MVDAVVRQRTNRLPLVARSDVCQVPNLGTIISDTYGTYQNLMGSRMPDLPSMTRMDKTLGPFLQKNTETYKFATSQQVL